MSQQYIYCDVSSIRKVGLNSYLNNYFWPVSDKDHKIFLNKIYKIYFDIVFRIKDKKVLNIALIESSFIQNVLEQVCHYNFVREYAYKNKCELIFSDTSKKYLFPNWNNFSNYYKKIYSKPGIKNKFFKRVCKKI